MSFGREKWQEKEQLNSNKLFNNLRGKYFVSLYYVIRCHMYRISIICMA